MAETVYLWKSIGGWARMLRIKGRWFYLGDSAHDLRDWMGRHPECSIVRRGGERIIARAYAQHGATLGALRKSVPPLPERWK